MNGRTWLAREGASSCPSFAAPPALPLSLCSRCAMLSSAVCLIACSLARLPYIPFESVGRQGKGVAGLGFGTESILHQSCTLAEHTILCEVDPRA